MRRLFLVLVACSAALFIPLLVPLFAGRMFTMDDFGAYHIPFRYLYSQALHRGDSILWTPAVFSGYYIFGEGQVGMAHPWHLLLYRFLPLVVAVNVEMISSYVAMFGGMVLLLKRFDLAKEARWFGAMVFTFSSFNVFHLIHLNIVAVVAHIPWLLLAAHTMVVTESSKTRARASVALALIFASQVLAGHPQHVWYGLIAVACLYGYFVWTNMAIRRFAPALAAYGIGLLMAGVQLLPLLDVAAASQRTQWSEYDALTFSLHPLNILQLWSPVLFNRGALGRAVESYSIHEFIVYNGAFCTVALAWVAIRWRELRGKTAVRGLLLAAGVALLLAFGRYAGLYASLVSLPGLRWFRAPSRHLMLVDLSLSLVAAIVLDDLIGLISCREKIASGRLWPLAIPAVLSVLTAVAASILVAWRGLPLHGVTYNAPWIALFVIVPLLFAGAARGAQWTLPLLIVITACDQGYWGFQYIFSDPYRPMMTIEELAHQVETPANAKAGDQIVWTGGAMRENLSILNGLRVWPGYVGLPPSHKLPWGGKDLIAERISGARWIVTGAGIRTIEPTAPRARLVANAVVTSDLIADLRRVDVLTDAIVEDAIDGLSGPSGSVRILEDRPGRIVVETTTPARQLLVVTERFDKGWHVEGAGAPLPVFGDFLGSVVEAGTHQVTFEFRPRSFRYGLAVSVLGLALLLTAASLMPRLRLTDT